MQELEEIDPPRRVHIIYLDFDQTITEEHTYHALKSKGLVNQSLYKDQTDLSDDIKSILNIVPCKQNEQYWQALFKKLQNQGIAIKIASFSPKSVIEYYLKSVLKLDQSIIDNIAILSGSSDEYKNKNTFIENSLNGKKIGNTLLVDDDENNIRAFSKIGGQVLHADEQGNYLRRLDELQLYINEQEFNIIKNKNFYKSLAYLVIKTYLLTKECCNNHCKEIKILLESNPNLKIEDIIIEISEHIREILERISQDKFDQYRSILSEIKDKHFIAFFEKKENSVNKLKDEIIDHTKNLIEEIKRKIEKKAKPVKVENSFWGCPENRPINKVSKKKAETNQDSSGNEALKEEKGWFSLINCIIS